MTIKELKDILEKNNIPDNVKIMTNSGWECSATGVGAVYYSASKNEIHLLQDDYYPASEYDENSLKEENEKAHDWVSLEMN